MLMGQRSLENPSTPLSAPDDWLYDAFGSGPSSSGINVSRVTALTYPAFWRGINLISDAMGKCPIFVYRQSGNGREKAKEHPAYRLLRRKPNPIMTASVFKKCLQHHALMEGNGYAYISRRGDGRPEQMIPLNPDLTYPVRANGVLWYMTKIKDDDIKVRGENIFHVKGLSFDGFVGYSVIAKAREALGLGMAAQRYGSIFFRNGSRPYVALEYPGKLGKEAQENLKTSWERAHSGLDNSHKVALLQEGVKLHTYNINARDAQLAELRQLQIREVANILGLPPHKLGDTARTSYNSLEQENQALVDDCYDPWMVAWEEEGFDKLLTEEEKESESHEIEFSRRHLVKPNLQTRTAFYQSALGNGYLSVDEVRAEEGWNPLSGGEGSQRFRPANLVSLVKEKSDGSQTDDDPPQDENKAIQEGD